VPRALPAGTVLDRHYLVGRVLGAGGFGITYLCADTRLQQPVAVKEYLPRDWAARRADGRTACAATERDADDYQGGLEKFLREARILAKLSEHPNIVPVLNFFEEHGTGYMVMRYLEGHTLDAVRRARGGRIAAAEAVPYILAVLDGLRAVHEVGLVHRDVKPQNVFVTTAGQVKLFDFGSLLVR
jgi:serine/threonine protein kinase